MSIETDFQTQGYLDLNKARLEHLASLGLGLSYRTVLDVGAGPGDLAPFFFERGCEVTFVEGREELCSHLQARYRSCAVKNWDLGALPKSGREKWDVGFFYGTLQHIENPSHALGWLAKRCKLLLVETLLRAEGAGKVEISPHEEPEPGLLGSLRGMGCRPTRKWLYDELCKGFEHVYTCRTQPAHDEYPLDWSSPGPGPNWREVFVASQSPIGRKALFDGLRGSHERFEKYSGEGEDMVILRERSRSNSPGAFLDLGAYDGKTISNTRLLHLAGSGGTLVEASPGSVEKLREAYADAGSEVKIVHALVSAKAYPEATPFWDTSNGVATVHPEYVNRNISPHGMPFIKRTMDSLPISRLLREYPGPYAVLSVDLEGSSVEVLEAIDLARLGAEVVCVEWFDMRRAVAAEVQMAERDVHMAEHGFHRCYANNSNAVYVRVAKPKCERNPDISILLGTYNRLAALKEAIESIPDSVKGMTYEAIVTDGGSTDGTQRWLRDRPDVVLVEEHSIQGGVKAFNQAYLQAAGRYVTTFNDDSAYVKGCLHGAISLMDENPAVGFAALAHDLRGSFGFMDVYGVRYANYAVMRMSVAREIALRQGGPCCYQNPIYRTYACDVEQSIWARKIGCGFAELDTCRVHDNLVKDGLREVNEQQKNLDNAICFSRWPSAERILDPNAGPAT